MSAVQDGTLPSMPSKKKSKKKSAAKSTKPKGAGKAKVTKKSKSKTRVEKLVSKKAKARIRKRTPSLNAEAELRREFQSRNTTAGRISPRQSADFEGLSRAEQSDSESVDELVEEGNLFEAGAVAGVEEADNSDEQEVHTHEIQEDDVPGEYLDEK